MKNLYFFFFLLVSVSLNAQFLQIEDGQTAGLSPEELAVQILQNDDFQVLSVSYTGDDLSIGSFEGVGESPIGIEHGMVLSTGRVDSVPAPGSTFASTSTAGEGDSDLSQITMGSTINDASALTVEFIPFTDTLVIDFVFGSEEYPEFACSAFNDVFGLFLSGPGITGPFSDNAINIALLPDSSVPLSINTLHPMNGENCPAINDEYYIDNNNSDNQPVYDGFTTVIPIRFPVVPFQVYSMKLAVADAGDTAFDTGTFLQFSDAYNGFSGFFDPQFVTLPETGEAVNIALDLTDANPVVFPIEVEIAGTAENGIDYAALQSTYTLTEGNPVLDFDLQPLNDAADENPESIELRISSGGEYLRSVFYYITDQFSAEPVVSNLCDAGINLSLVENSGAEYAFANNNPQPINDLSSTVATESTIEVSGVPYQNIFTPALVKEVCVNVEHPWVGDIDMYLIAPDGKRLTLSSDNGADGDNYAGTCFVPVAAQSIRGTGETAPAAAAPFTGSFLPEGNWEYLHNSPINGTWTLLIKDDGVGFSGQLLDWHITFQENILSPEAVVWSTGETGLSIEYTGEIPGTVTAELAAPYFGSYTFEITGDEDGSNTPVNLTENTCNENFALTVNGNTYDINNPTGIEVIENGAVNGCDSVINVTLNFFDAPENEVVNGTWYAGESLTVADTELTEPGNYIVSATNDTGCAYDIYVNYLPESPSLPPGVAFPNLLPAIDCAGTEYCFAAERQAATNLVIKIDGQTIGTPADFPACFTETETRFIIPSIFYDADKTWEIESVAGFADEANDALQSAELLVQQLNFGWTQYTWYLGGEPGGYYIYVREIIQNDMIVLADLNSDATISLLPTQAEYESGAVIPLTGAESTLLVTNETDFTDFYELQFMNTVETTTEEVAFTEDVGLGQLTATFSYTVAPDDLCSDYVSASNVCAGGVFTSVNIQNNGAGGIDVTALVENIDFGMQLPDACFEFCDNIGTCDTVRVMHSLDFVDSVVDDDLQRSIYVTPNPTQNFVKITSEATMLQNVKIYDISGKFITEINSEFTSNDLQIDLTAYSAGVYFLAIETEAGTVKKRVVKE